MPVMNMIEALNYTLHEQFAKDERLISFGEDAGFFGGVFRVTQGLQQKFGEERSFDTPLAESGIVGFAIGMAQNGLRPVCEIQFADYIFPAYDQIVNELAKMRYRTGNEYAAPVVIRTPYGGGIHGGHYHSQSPEAQFLHTPGLMVVFPSSPYTARGLLVTALRSPDPVIFFEPKRLYRSLKEEVPLEEYAIPFGKARIAKEGKDLTIIGWGAQHLQNMEAARQLLEEGIDAEVIDCLTLNPLDFSTLSLSLQKTGRAIIAHEAPLTQGFGAEISARLQEKCFYYLQAPITRVCGLDTPFPHTLEKEYLPDAARVKQAAIDLLNH